jgi:murein L,D-transpeptidase YcbB/YkuD
MTTPDFSQNLGLAEEDLVEAPPLEAELEEEEASPEEAEEVDYKARFLESSEALKRMEQRAKSAEGRLLSTKRLDDIEALLRKQDRERLVDRRLGEVEMADLEPEERQRRRREIEDESREEEGREKVSSAFQDLGRRMQAKVELYSLDDRAEVNDIKRKWADLRGKSDLSIDNLLSVYQELDAFVDHEQERKRTEDAQRAEADRVRRNREDGTLEVGVGERARGASVTAKQDLVNRLARGEDMSDADIKRASDALDEGILPQLLE